MYVDACLYVYVRVCGYLCVYVYVYMYVHVHVRFHRLIQALTNKPRASPQKCLTASTHVISYKSTCKHTYENSTTNTCPYSHVQPCIRQHSPYMHPRMQAYMHAGKHIPLCRHMHTSGCSPCICMYIIMYASL